MLHAAGGIPSHRRELILRLQLRDVVHGEPGGGRRAGSVTTSISRVSLAMTSTWPAPGTRASRGRMT